MNIQFVQRTGCILIFLVILIGAASIPFQYESQSILYKFGRDKTLLRLGKIVGLLGATLFFMQMLLRARIKFLEEIFSLKIFNNLHILNGKILAILVCFHPPLVFEPNDLGALQLRYWPEAIGGLVLLCILALVFTATFKNQLNIPYKTWLVTHRYGSIITSILITVHVLFVSESFETGLPRLMVIISFVLFSLLWIQLRFRAGIRK